MLDDLRAGAKAVALSTIVSGDPEQALRRVVLGAGMGVALRVADDLRAIAEHLGGHLDDFHPVSSSWLKPLRREEREPSSRPRSTSLLNTSDALAVPRQWLC
jgi:hypothetical protein